MNEPFRYLPESLPGGASGADALLDWCLHTPPWQSESIRMFGRTIDVPRRVAWYGDAGVCYRYSGITHVGEGWPAKLARLRDALAEQFDQPVNFVLMNLYRDGRDWMGWHRDDEREMFGRVVSASLGASRRFRLDDDATRHALELEHGSIIVFDGRLRHTLTRTSKPVTARVNLTFRHIKAA